MQPPAGAAARLFPNIGQASLLVIGGLALQVACGAIVAGFASPFTGGIESGIKVILNPWVLSAVHLLVTAMIISLGLRSTRESAGRFFAIRPFAGALVPAMIATSLGLALVLSETDSIIVELAHLLPTFNPVQPQIFDFAGHPVGGFLLAIVLAPLGEEYLFRGMIQRGLLTRHRAWVAIGLSALLFGLMHGNVRQLFLATVIGLVFGWWYLRTASVGPGIIGHAVFNSVAWLTASFPDATPSFWLHNSSGPVVHQPWWLTASGILVTGMGLWRFRRVADALEPPALPATPTEAEPPLLDPLPPLLNPSPAATPSFDGATVQPSDSPVS